MRTAIPSITTLASDYGVAVITVQKAIAILKDEGLLFGVPGKGTFVTEGGPLMKLPGWTDSGLLPRGLQQADLPRSL